MIEWIKLSPQQRSLTSPRQLVINMTRETPANLLNINYKQEQHKDLNVKINTTNICAQTNARETESS